MPSCRPETVSFRYSPAHCERPGSTGVVEVEEPLRDAAGGRDHDHHHQLRLQQQHLDVADVRRLERRRGHEREQARDLGEHLRRRLQRRLDLRVGGVQVERERGRLRIEPLEQPVGVIAVAALRRHAPRRRVRMRQQPERLELGELGAHRRRRRVEADRSTSVFEPTGCAGGDVLLDHAPEDLLLPRRELRRVCLNGHLQGILAADAATPLRRGARPSRRRRGSGRARSA